MRLLHFILHPSSFILLFAVSSFAQLPYEVGDWTSYRDFRYARALDAGAHELFVATSGGLLEYRLLYHTWSDPIVVGYGLSAAVELDDPILLLFDEQTGYVWLATRRQLLTYDVNAERWRRVHENLWPAGQRVVNLGVGGTNVYLETVPEAFYASFFDLGSPLPNDKWWGLVTRYKGSRNFGGLTLDIDPQEDRDIRWRGLRSRRPLTSEELLGEIGAPPANFPSLLIPGGWVWQADGTLLDPYLRTTSVTDWLVDGYGTLWLTFWGAGVLEADLRTRFTKFYGAGPAGNDVRALWVGREDVWLGGFNSGDRKGITHADAGLKSWRFYERRDNSRLRSTDVFDIAFWNGAAWFATDEGLLALENKGEEWKLFTVSQSLQSDQIRALAAADSELWIGNSRGLSVMTLPGREIWRADNGGIELGGVTDLTLCADTLYVGTAAGLFKGSVRQRRFAFTPLDPGLLNAPVVEISAAGSRLWLATAEGVQVYDQASGQSKSWYANVHLNNSEPTCICATDSLVWVGTRLNGFYRYRVATGEWISYTTADGLLDNRVQVIRRDGDDLLIGTASGLTRFYWNRPGRLR